MASEADSALLQRFKNLLSLAGLITAIFYGFLWLAYYQYYSSFAILPEQVGLDKVELLSQALVGPVAILVGSILIATPLIVILIVGSLAYNVIFTIPLLIVGNLMAGTISDTPKDIRGLLQRRINLIIEHWRLASKVIVSLTSAASLIFLLVPLYQEAATAGNDVVEHGRVVRDIFRQYGPFRIPVFNQQYGPFEVPLLSIQALPVNIAWKKDEDAPDIIARGTNCMLYLGKNTNNALLYDVQHKRVIYLTSGDVIITTRPNDNMNPNCLDS